MQPPFASFLLLMPRRIADPSSVLLLMMTLIADATAFKPYILVCFPCILLYVADLDALCRLRLPMLLPPASFLLLMLSPISDSSPFLLVMMPMISDAWCGAGVVRAMCG